MSYTIMNLNLTTKKKFGPMDQLLYTLKLKKVKILVYIMYGRPNYLWSWKQVAKEIRSNATSKH